MNFPAVCAYLIPAFCGKEHVSAALYADFVTSDHEKTAENSIEEQIEARNCAFLQWPRTARGRLSPPGRRSMPQERGRSRLHNPGSAPMS
jgi:hypothetical protein